MKYLKLIKRLYLADREALSRWGRPITTDNLRLNGQRTGSEPNPQTD